MQITIARPDKEYGPYSLEQVNQFLVLGQLHPQDLAWFEGSPNWITLSQVPGVIVPDVAMPPDQSSSNPPLSQHHPSPASAISPPPKGLAKLKRNTNSGGQPPGSFKEKHFPVATAEENKKVDDLVREIQENMSSYEVNRKAALNKAETRSASKIRVVDPATKKAASDWLKDKLIKSAKKHPGAGDKAFLKQIGLDPDELCDPQT